MASKLENTICIQIPWIAGKVHAIVLIKGGELGINKQIPSLVQSDIVEAKRLSIVAVGKGLTVIGCPEADDGGACQDKPEPADKEYNVGAFEADEWRQLYLFSKQIRLVLRNLLAEFTLGRGGARFLYHGAYNGLLYYPKLT